MACLLFGGRGAGGLSTSPLVCVRQPQDTSEGIFLVSVKSGDYPGGAWTLALCCCLVFAQKIEVVVLMPPRLPCSGCEAAPIDPLLSLRFVTRLSAWVCLILGGRYRYLVIPARVRGRDSRGREGQRQRGRPARGPCRGDDRADVSPGLQRVEQSTKQRRRRCSIGSRQAYWLRCEGMA